MKTRKKNMKRKIKLVELNVNFFTSFIIYLRSDIVKKLNIFENLVKVKQILVYL